MIRRRVHVEVDGAAADKRRTRHVVRALHRGRPCGKLHLVGRHARVRVQSMRSSAEPDPGQSLVCPARAVAATCEVQNPGLSVHYAVIRQRPIVVEQHLDGRRAATGRLSHRTQVVKLLCCPGGPVVQEQITLNIE